MDWEGGADCEERGANWEEGGEWEGGADWRRSGDWDERDEGIEKVEKGENTKSDGIVWLVKLEGLDNAFS